MMKLNEQCDEDLYELWFSAPTPSERQSAADELERRHRSALKALCYRILKNAYLADEAAADAFLKLYQLRRRFTSSLRAWLWTTGRNRSFEKLKEDRESEPLPTAAAALITDPAEDCIRKEEKAALDRCLDMLPVDEREFFELCVRDALTYDEAAEVVGWRLTPSGYNYRFCKTLEALRACLRKSGILD